jgi:hypothetical protein
MGDKFFVDFDDDDFTDLASANTKESKEAHKPQFSHKYNFNADTRTTEYYKVLRLTKQDPFTNMEVNEDCAFKFDQMWDSTSGERTGKDPYGPLWFDPDSLMYYFYTNRLINLWDEPQDEQGGYYQGRYGDIVGTGENMDVISRGSWAHKYLFRLPIDCYLHKGHNPNLITMGPKLTEQELAQIDELVAKQGTYRKTYNLFPVSLAQLKKYYDQALSKTPDLPPNTDVKKLTHVQLLDIREKANRAAVEKIKKM